jgi:lactose/L-arabinose transport system permease protein
MKPKLTLSRRKSIVGWVFIIPASILIAVFYFYPIIKALILSFQSGVGNNLSFAGFYNYIRLFSDKTFLTALTNVFIYLILQVPIMILLALILASILNDESLKFKSFFRTAIFIPAATSLVAYSIIFRSIFQVDGLVNSILMNINLISSPINWMGEAWPARILIVIALLWRWTGYNMIFYLAGLQGINPSIYEAAKIDGANAYERFRFITIPILKPIILLTTIMSTNGTLKLFAEPKNLTEGGPANATLSITQYVYRMSFEYVPRFGYASAMAFVIFILVAILAYFQLKVGDER